MIRTGCKDVASAKIEGFYLSRTRGAVATAELIKELIEKTDYIYPSSEVISVLFFFRELFTLTNSSLRVV